jgi:tight adherence protein C
MGTPLGRILRMQADRLRERRAQAAEKAANEAPVKLLFPLIFFIFPTVFLVLFGPIVFRIFFVGL